MITLYYAPESRANVALSLLRRMGHETSVDIATVHIDRQDGQGRKDPNNPHPEGKVPLLVADGVAIREQGAILLWLTDHYDSTLGRGQTDPGRGAYLSWLFYYHAVIEPVLYLGFLELGDHPMIKNWCRDMEAVTASLETALADRPYLVDERFSAADLLIASPFGWFPDFMPDSPLVRDWVARCQAEEDSEYLSAFNAEAMAKLGLKGADAER